MNDASGGYPAEKYAQTIRSLISIVRAKSPATECLLVSGMDANPEWSKAAPELHAAYHKQLQMLCEEIPATALCDVYTPWQILAARKGFHSLTGNGVNHPNDYGHRLYADSVLQAILP